MLDRTPKWVPSRIKDYREQRGLTQVEAAQRASVSGRQWQRFEGGEAVPTIPVLYRIAEALGINAKDLL